MMPLFNNTIAKQLLAFVVLSAAAIIIIEDPGSIDRLIRDICGDPPIIEEEEDCRAAPEGKARPQPVTRV